MYKCFHYIFLFLSLGALSACVTHNYENDNETPILENDSSNNEIAMTRISLGMGYLKMGNTEQAKINLEKAKRFAPNLTQVYTAFAHYYDTVGEPDLSSQSYEKALAINPDDPDTLNNYGVFLCRQKRYNEAEKYILEAIAIPSYILVSQSYENLALCQLKAANFVKAELYFDKSILHSPSRSSSLLQMARLQYIKSDYENAQLYIQRYEKASRRFAPNALALAYKVNEKMHRERVAKNYAGMLVKLFPNSYETKQYLLNALEVFEADETAKKYQLHQQAKKAKSAQKRVVVLSPSSKAINVRPKTQKENKDQQKIKKSAISSAATIDIATEFDEAGIPIHRLKIGENLFSISKVYNIQMKALEEWNNIARKQLLKAGDIIYLADPNINNNK